MTDEGAIRATQQLVIRKPVSEVFRAFADPEITTRFWFNRSSGPLASGALVEWYWDVHGVSAVVRVLEFEPHERILFEWAGPDGQGLARVRRRPARRRRQAPLRAVDTSGAEGAESVGGALPC